MWYIHLFLYILIIAFGSETFYQPIFLSQTNVKMMDRADGEVVNEQVVNEEVEEKDAEEEVEDIE